MNALDLVNVLGKKLIGRKVLTIPMGTWPGGKAKVINLGDDPNAPDIVMNVKPLDGQIDPDDDTPFESMGIFCHEDITLL